jgi:uncharacterized membrane protein YphA (DoxX/SURF4 family)
MVWVVQIILGSAFLFTGFSKIFAYPQVIRTMEVRLKGGPVNVSRGQAALVGLAEIAGAVGVLFPVDLWPPHVLVRVACAGLALLMIAAGIYHARRKEAATPSVVLLLLALFVIVGRTPR